MLFLLNKALYHEYEATNFIATPSPCIIKWVVESAVAQSVNLHAVEHSYGARRRTFAAHHKGSAPIRGRCRNSDGATFARPTNSEAAYGTALDRGTGAPGPAASSYQTVCFILLWSMDGQSMGIITNLFQQPPSLSREAINAKNGPHLKSRLPVRVENRSTPSPCCACHSCCMPTPRLSPPLLYRLHASRR